MKIKKKKKAKYPIIFTNDELKKLDNIFDILLYDEDMNTGKIKDKCLMKVNVLVMETIERINSGGKEKGIRFAIHPAVIEAAHEHSVPPHKILSNDKRSFIAYVRRIVAWRLRKQGHTITEIAKILNKTPSAITRMLQMARKERNED